MCAGAGWQPSDRAQEAVWSVQVGSLTSATCWQRTCGASSPLLGQCSSVASSRVTSLLQGMRATRRLKLNSGGYVQAKAPRPVLQLLHLSPAGGSQQDNILPRRHRGHRPLPGFLALPGCALHQVPQRPDRPGCRQAHSMCSAVSARLYSLYCQMSEDLRGPMPQPYAQQRSGVEGGQVRSRLRKQSDA